MHGIFRDLIQGNSQLTIAVLDAGGKVMCTNHPEVLPDGTSGPLDLEADFKSLSFKGIPYLASVASTDGYQGFFGLPWYGLAMIDMETASRKEEEETGLEKDLTRKLNRNINQLSSVRFRFGKSATRQRRPARQ